MPNSIGYRILYTKIAVKYKTLKEKKFTTESHGMALKMRLIIELSFINFDIEYLISMLYSNGGFVTVPGSECWSWAADCALRVAG